MKKFLSILTIASMLFNAKTVYANEGFNVNRIYGKNRYETSMAIANEFIKEVGSIDSVILANGDTFPDSLSGTTLCKKYNAPLLLINKQNQNRILEFIYKNLKSEATVYILGGTGVVDNSVAKELISNHYKVKRLAGTNRFKTNKAIIDEMNIKEGTPLFICNGNGFSDTLSVSAIAGKNEFPIVLVNKDNMQKQTKEQIKKIKPSKFYIIGGTGVVSDKNVKELQSFLPNAKFCRLGGKNRYETCQKINDEF